MSDMFIFISFILLLKLLERKSLSDHKNVHVFAKRRKKYIGCENLHEDFQVETFSVQKKQNMVLKSHKIKGVI